MTPEHKEKIRQALLKFNATHKVANPQVSESNRTRTITDEQREARSRSVSGEANPFFGKTHSEESRERIAEIRRSRVPNKLKKFGITTEEYFAKISAGFKWCSVHKDWTPASEFYKSQATCKPCAAKLHRARVLAHYGVTPEWYDAKLAEQNGGCAICGCPIHRVKGGHLRLHVDHSHATNVTRGLLCHLCNHAIERIETIHGWAEKAAAYLLKYSN